MKSLIRREHWTCESIRQGTMETFAEGKKKKLVDIQNSKLIQFAIISGSRPQPLPQHPSRSHVGLLGMEAAYMRITKASSSMRLFPCSGFWRKLIKVSRLHEATLSKDQKQFPVGTETKIHSWVQHTSLGSSSSKLIAVKMLNKILLTLVVLKVYVTGLYNKIIQFSPSCSIMISIFLSTDCSKL